jgi:cysteine desulfurase
MPVYLDHNATTPLAEGVLEAMLPYLSDQYGNASSAHSMGYAARAAVDRARAQVARLVNAGPEQVVFTGTGTEANNLAIKGVAGATASGRILISAVEHASVRSPALALKRQGWEVAMLPVDAQGRVAAATLQEHLRPDTRLVSVMLANNETGVLQDIAALGKITRKAGSVFHSDATQAAGKIKIDFAALGVQLMSLSAHKLYGPKGVGALVIAEGVELLPLIHGGGKALRGGSENVAAIVGFGAAAELAAKELEQRAEHLLTLRRYLEQRLHEIPSLVIFAEQAERLPNTVLCSVPEFAGETLIAQLDRQGLCLSTGAACTSGTLAPSQTLAAMGVEKRLLRNVLRISLGINNTPAELDQLICALRELLARHTPWAVA